MHLAEAADAETRLDSMTPTAYGNHRFFGLCCTPYVAHVGFWQNQDICS
jgi:hypothetical protein